MTKRAWTVVLALGLCLSTQGCGDDDDEDNTSDEGGSGGSGNAGRGGSGSGNAGSGNAGRGGSGSGNSGSGSSDPIAECMLDEMMGGPTTDCEGIEEYGECSNGCLDDCQDGCADYYDCIQDADDPCMPTGCTPSSQCSSCISGASSCFLDCIDLIMCGETMAGGACDQLEECCATFSMPDVCEQLASAARAGGGDMACEMAMDAFCM
jgi:hypothetical protein